MHSKHIISIAIIFLTISICLLTITINFRDGTASKKQTQCQKLDTQVLILGAGMAGVSAGKTLQDNSLKDFIILEAQPQIGGRMKMLEINSGVGLELGANWIAGIDPLQPEKHPLYALAQQCGGIKGSYADSIIVYNSSGDNITANLRNKTLQAANIKATNLSLSRLKQGLPDMSVREGLTESGWIVASDGDKWLDWFNIDFHLGESPEKSSLLQNIPDPTFMDFGDPNRSTIFLVTDQDGYVKLAKCLADQTLTVNDTRLHLNERVTDIEWSDECVCVSTSRQDGSHHYCSAYAIFTFSLGVLQSTKGELKFSPKLPQWKLDAINQVDMTNYLKMYAEFTSDFWDSIPYIGYAGGERGYYPLFISQNLFLPNGSNILQITLTGALADRVVRQPLPETKSQIYQVLRGIYGDKATEPIRVVVADWIQDPLFYGTYSNLPLGITDETVPRIKEHLGRLYFSGEVTSVEYNGYVHGAYFAGIDTAEDVIKHFYSNSPVLLPTHYSLVFAGLWVMFSLMHVT